MSPNQELFSKDADGKSNEYSSVIDFCHTLKKLAPGIYLDKGPRLMVDGVPINIVSKSNLEQDQIAFLFCFHGALNQDDRSIPFFQHAFSSANLCGGKTTVISIADPSLRIDKKLTTAWYAGDHEVDTMKILGKLVDSLYQDYPLAYFQFEAASSGARAALLLSHRVPNSWCLLFNPLPQLRGLSYDLGNYLKTCWQNKPDAYGGIVADNLAELYAKGHQNYILTLQNAFDVNFTRSILPFMGEAFLCSPKFLMLSSYYKGMLKHDFPWEDAKVWRKSFLLTRPATFESIVENASKSLGKNYSSNNTAGVTDRNDLLIAKHIASTALHKAV